MTYQYGMLGKLTTDPDNRDALVEILTQAAALMTDVEGCHSYIVSRDANDAGAVWVTEYWTDKAAHDASLALPKVRDLITKAMPLLTGQPEGTTLEPVGGKGL